MRLYRVRTHFIAKDLDKDAILEFILAKNEDEVYEYINNKHCIGDWPGCAEMTREDIMAARGDFDADPHGEFYDQKFGWDDLREVSSEEIATLKRLGILA